MRELVRIVEEPRTCSYLPEQTAALEYRVVQELGVEEYERMLERGYRRFGTQLFRPQCPNCRQCISIRFCVNEFRPTAGLRRVRRRNRHIRVRHDRLFLTARHLELYRLYHEFMAEKRGWMIDDVSGSDYYDSFVSGGDEFASQWLYYDAEQLMGVALMDETPNAISMVYFFHDPAWRPLSPGTFSILVQLDYARRNGKKYAYPGYWISANSSMAYKERFRPFERLVGEPGDEEPAEWVRHEPAPGAMQGAA